MSGSSKPGSLCAANNPVVIDPGTLACHRSPSPGPVCLSRGRRRAAVQIGTLVFSEAQLTCKGR